MRRHRIDRPGYFYRPTVIERAAAGSRACNEKSLRTARPAGRFEDLCEAIDRANACPTVSLPTRSRTMWPRSSAVAGLQAGMVGINHFGVSQPETPFGGVKDSGYGSESGLEGLLGYTDVKFVSVAS